MCMSRGLLKTRASRTIARASRTVDNIENDADIDMLHIGTILRINSDTSVGQDDKAWYVNGHLN